MENLHTLNILEAHAKLKSKEISAEELTKACLNQIKKYNDKFNIFTVINEKQALQQSKKIDKESNFNHPLKGIPYALKDNFCSLDTPSTASSQMLEGFQSPYEATVVKKLKKVGAISLGKTNTDEFTMGSSTETSYYGPTKNPWDKNRVAGGSSGGPTAAVAADMCLFALGTDTGGSIRQPSALCGTVGLKVSYGRTSRFGVMSMASSLDTIGPIGKTVADTATILKTIAGRDIHDSTTPDIPVPDYSAALTGNIKGLKIGIPKEYFVEGMEIGVTKSVQNSIEKLKELGAEIINISLPHTKYVLPVYYVVASLEVSSNMARYDGIRYGLKSSKAKNLLDHYFQLRSKGFGSEVKRRVMIGTYIHSLGYDGAYYIKAQKVRTLLKQDYSEAYKKVDVILTPISPTTAFKIGEKHSDPITMYLCDIFTVSANLVGMPSISIPCGFSNNLPVGLQIIGPQFKEEIVLKTADAYEKNTTWHLQKPNLTL